MSRRDWRHRRGHVPPHRWADLARGQVSQKIGAAWERHAADCEACARTRQRVLAALGDLATVREGEAPDLGWDHIGARVYWVTSSERKQGERRKGGGLRRWRWGIGVVAAAAAVALALAFGSFGWGGGSRAPAVASSGGESAPGSAKASAAPAAARDAAPLRGIVTYRQGQVTVNGAPLASRAMNRPVEEGARIETGAGRVAIQFGAGSALAVGPHSVATLQSFNERRVRIRIEGRIDVEVSHRAPEQTFAVVAGGYAVRVRGTIFRVERRGRSLKVFCTRGKVVVDRGDRAVAVEAGRRLRIWENAIDAAAAEPLAPGELAALERSMAVPMLPAWTDARSALATSTTLSVNAAADAPVIVDGVEVGRGPLAVRMMSGRHYVGSAGQRQGRWVDLAPGSRRVAVAGGKDAERDDVGDAAASSGRERAGAAARARAARHRRKAELDAAVAKSPAFGRCMRPLAKQGLADGSFVVFDIGINADGSQGYLNLVKSNVPAAVARCLRHAVDGVAFKPGSPATIRARLSF